jgi:iron donor protein CyaY
MSSDTPFDSQADAMLERIAQAIETRHPGFDYDLEGGILTVTLPGGRQAVINRQSVMREIWLASPGTGGHHFRLDGESWVSTRDATRTLPALLSDEFGLSLGD